MTAERAAESVASAPGALAEAPTNGTVEERYRSLYVIGRGGMGTVEVALERGEGGFERIVALKRLLPESSNNARHKEMFLREARLAALLTHPNVVHAFAFGELHGELYLAMEYVEGEPLSRLLQAAREKEGGLVPAFVAHVLAQICDGLHAAHELKDAQGTPLNVVHRDVSPHNVMISYDGRVKLLDFGVAKFDAGQAMTRTGEIKGKMGYMSPEQAMGEACDRRSDLWSIGAVLFECISGRKMWGDGTDLEVMRKLALEDPPSLYLHPNAPKALAELHARLVARSSADRPATALAVADALRAYVASSGTAPDARVVRSVMMRLFAREAERQRTALAEALERAAPSHVEELRRSLEPRADAFHERVTQSAPPSRKATATDTSESVVLTSAAPRPARRGVIALAVALAVIAAVAALTFGRAPPTATAPPQATSAIPTTTATAFAIPITTASAIPITTATATAAKTATTTATIARAPAVLPAPSAAHAPVPKASASPPPTPTTKPPPDVDPTPF